jgi:hypothetical protein
MHFADKEAMKISLRIIFKIIGCRFKPTFQLFTLQPATLFR